jgi:hypothetical protein
MQENMNESSAIEDSMQEPHLTGKRGDIKRGIQNKNFAATQGYKSEPLLPLTYHKKMKSKIVDKFD